jgi:ATP-dependent DNA helicase RecQ
MDYNAAGTSTPDGGFAVEPLNTGRSGHDVLSRLMDASARIPGLSFMSSENLEVLEHLGVGRDLIITGPDRIASLTCAVMPALAQCGLVVVLTHSMHSIRRLKSRFENLGAKTDSFDLAPSKAEKRKIWEAMDQGDIQILLVTPGRLTSQRFRERLRRRSIAIVIVDQAQMMSPWSHRFLPNYRFVGSYIASLNGDERPPQKIALAWNPSGRINHDLTKLLLMNNPYHGRLVADALPGFGVETSTVATDADRGKLIRQELERSGGQGVIYCNSIKQLYDTSALLESRGEEFAVIRPGLDEYSVQRARAAFEAGRIRVIAVIGSFLSEIESAPGLEFAIFNGMPESTETLGRELFSVDDAGFIRCLIIVGEKDYFQHRFLIDKNYPDALVLRACVQGVRDVFGSKKAVTPDALSAHVKMATPYPGDDVEHCIQVLFREGMLERVIENDSGQTFVLFNVSAEEEAGFWHEYPLRKIDHVARLDRMREFVAKDGDRARRLQNLIRQ